MGCTGRRLQPAATHARGIRGDQFIDLTTHARGIRGDRWIIAQGGIYNLPTHLSHGARDLIPRMLVVDPLKRITIPEIRCARAHTGLPDLACPRSWRPCFWQHPEATPFAGLHW